MMNVKYIIYSIFIFIALFSYNCAGGNSKKNSLNRASQSQIENNKVRVSVEQQKNKILELEGLVEKLNSRIEYQENMLSTLSEEFNDQMQVVNRYDSSSSEITNTLIKMKNKFEILEDRAFYTDSVYFEIINDLVKIDSKIQTLSVQYNDSSSKKNKEITDNEYSQRYSKALNSFFNDNQSQNSLDEFQDLISINKNHSLSDNCQYWIGEVYYKQKLFQKSISEFSKVFEFSDSNKLDDAQYKIILCYVNLGDYDLAKENLNKLKNDFQNSEYIDKAEKTIKQIIE